MESTNYFLIYHSSDPTPTSGKAQKAQEKCESQSGCEFCGHVGIHELKCYDEKRKTNIPLNKRLDKIIGSKTSNMNLMLKKGQKRAKLTTKDSRGMSKSILFSDKM